MGCWTFLRSPLSSPKVFCLLPVAAGGIVRRCDTRVELGAGKSRLQRRHRNMMQGVVLAGYDNLAQANIVYFSVRFVCVCVRARRLFWVCNHFHDRWCYISITAVWQHLAALGSLPLDLFAWYITLFLCASQSLLSNSARRWYKPKNSTGWHFHFEMPSLFPRPLFFCWGQILCQPLRCCRPSRSTAGLTICHQHPHLTTSLLLLLTLNFETTLSAWIEQPSCD